MFSINIISIYVGIIVLAFITASLWTALSAANSASVAQRLKTCLPITMQVTICSLGYSVFFFVLMLSVGIAIWLVLLGLVYLPADVLNNTFGKHWTENVVSSIMPYISRSSRAPGIFHQPILDYSTLCVLFLAPVAGIWSVISSHKRREAAAKSKTMATSSAAISETNSDDATNTKKDAA